MSEVKMDAKGNLHFENVNMGQALGVLADVVASYVSNLQAPAGADENTKKHLSQIAVSIFLHNLLMRSLHKEEMAAILDLIALELRDAARGGGDAEKEQQQSTN